ncbi:ABC transporter ATP-binding protein [Halogeometricum limi]|uniref:Cobalamin import ATP-binding protein BtuD n=1 Tax=Halogeometricum limi TaxID=555875 RepID=A0A1I6ISV7_9EURY|nr:ABC transporter ATP-binding protein [Halogeometricum limi]SFR69824.1 iron complex transport system ATP-binding protein [Halogeometricum limi]
MSESNHENDHERIERARNGEADDASALVGDGLTLSYSTSERPVVECDRIDIPRGEITALVGPNGSGKSTLLKALSKQLAPDTGRVLLDGRAVHEYDDKEFARELGLLSQENESPGSITVEELVYHGRYPHRGFFEQVGEADHRAVERAIELAGVDHLREQTVGNLSGGQKQLAWIAMVLAQDTDVLLLDEPTTYLDLHHQLRVMETVQQLNERRGVTVAVVLHDIAQAARFADYLVALQDGEVYDWGPPREVVTEELLADVFRVEAAVSYTPDPEIVPKHSL